MVLVRDWCPCVDFDLVRVDELYVRLIYSFEDFCELAAEHWKRILRTAVLVTHLL